MWMIAPLCISCQSLCSLRVILAFSSNCCASQGGFSASYVLRRSRIRNFFPRTRWFKPIPEPASDHDQLANDTPKTTLLCSANQFGR